MQPALIPTWSVQTGLRLSACFRHFSQAVHRQRGWIPDAYKQAKAAGNNSQDEPAGETQSEASEDEPQDLELAEVESLISSSKTLRWQSQFMDALEAEFADPSTFMTSLFDIERQQREAKPAENSTKPNQLVVIGQYIFAAITATITRPPETYCLSKGAFKKPFNVLLKALLHHGL